MGLTLLKSGHSASETSIEWKTVDIMKKLSLILCLTLFLSACGASDFPTLRNIRLTVFADASLSDTFPAVAASYREAYPGIRFDTQFGSSSALLMRLRDGDDCDIFLSASTEVMDALDNYGYLTDNTRVDFMENRLALAVPVGNPRGVRNFAHMASLIRQGGALFAAVNAGDPLGAYTQKLFSYYSVSDAALSRGVTYAPDVKETVTRVRSDMADGAIVYRTDADGLEIVDTADASMCGDIVYSAAVVSGAERPLAASAFLEYLTGPDAGEIFTRAGFAPVATQTEPSWTAPYWEALTPDEPDAGDGF